MATARYRYRFRAVAQMLGTAGLRKRCPTRSIVARPCERPVLGAADMKILPAGREGITSTAFQLVAACLSFATSSWHSAPLSAITIPAPRSVLSCSAWAPNDSAEATSVWPAWSAVTSPLSPAASNVRQAPACMPVTIPAPATARPTPSPRWADASRRALPACVVDPTGRS